MEGEEKRLDEITSCGSFLPPSGRVLKHCIRSEMRMGCAAMK
jgi:hypothetical protein